MGAITPAKSIINTMAEKNHQIVAGGKRANPRSTEEIGITLSSMAPRNNINVVYIVIYMHKVK